MSHAATPDDELYMRLALAEAAAAMEHDDVPIGAVVVHHGEIIARAHNQKELLRDATAHAEILALTQAAAALEAWRLTGCTAYVTLEPCVMCAGAFVQARVDRIVYGADDAKAGACRSLYRIPEDVRLNHRPQVTAGVLADECGQLLRDFFRGKR